MRTLPRYSRCCGNGWRTPDRGRGAWVNVVGMQRMSAITTSIRRLTVLRLCAMQEVVEIQSLYGS